MISVVLAVHNEAANLARCLSSVSTWADEIVVVDGESTDETIKIAQEFKAKIIKTTNKLNFHINKQMGIEAAKGDLILQLDADEVVDNELVSFIKRTHSTLTTKNSTPYDAWWIKRQNYFLGKFLTKGGQYPDPVIRLFWKGKARLPQKDVHEQMEVDGEVGWAEGHLIHYSNPTFSDYLRKFNTYTSFQAQKMAEKKLPFNWLNHLNYFIFKPTLTFLQLYLRHKGFYDGLAGFVFAMMSGLYHPISYLKYWELKHAR